MVVWGGIGVTGFVFMLCRILMPHCLCLCCQLWNELYGEEAGDMYGDAGRGEGRESVNMAFGCMQIGDLENLKMNH